MLRDMLRRVGRVTLKNYSHYLHIHHDTGNYNTLAVILCWEKRKRKGSNKNLLIFKWCITDMRRQVCKAKRVQPEELYVYRYALKTRHLNHTFVSDLMWNRSVLSVLSVLSVSKGFAYFMYKYVNDDVHLNYNKHLKVFFDFPSTALT